MEHTNSANSETKYVIQENSNSTSASIGQTRLPAWRARADCPRLMPGQESGHFDLVVQDAAQRMTPIDMRSPRLYALPMLLEDFVRKQEYDNDEGYNQKRAQYYVFDHDNLLVVKRLQFHCSRKATVCTTGDYGDL
jgi:hypothetical protein